MRFSRWWLVTGGRALGVAGKQSHHPSVGDLPWEGEGGSSVGKRLPQCPLRSPAVQLLALCIIQRANLKTGIRWVTMEWTSERILLGKTRIEYFHWSPGPRDLESSHMGWWWWFLLKSNKCIYVSIIVTRCVSMEGASTISLIHMIFYGGTPWHKMLNFCVRIFLSLSSYKRDCCSSLNFCWACDNLK